MDNRSTEGYSPCCSVSSAGKPALLKNTTETSACGTIDILGLEGFVRRTADLSGQFGRNTELTRTVQWLEWVIPGEGGYIRL
jgi:hypothetical protein